jgi:hypothetical protein
VTKFEQIQAARDTRLAKLQRGSWSVVKVNDDGREIVVQGNVTAIVAERLAGARRDTMSDGDVGDGWTFLAKSSRKAPQTETGGGPRRELQRQGNQW